MAVLKDYVQSPLTNDSEFLIIAKVEIQHRPQVLFQIFDASKELGQELQKEKGSKFSIDEAIELVSKSEVPCFGGPWVRENRVHSRFSFRQCCPDLPLLFFCDYWRQAAKGFIQGLNFELEFSRHRSLGHGDPECLDYIHTFKLVDKGRGNIPSFMRQKINPLIERLKQQQVDIALEGCAEHVLYLSLDEKLTPEQESKNFKLAFNTLRNDFSNYDFVLVKRNSTAHPVEDTKDGG